LSGTPKYFSRPVADGTGQLTPGALTGVSGGCCLRNLRGGGYVLLHGGAVVGKCDEAEEASGSLSGRAAEFPGIVEGWSLFENSSIKTGYGGRLARPTIVSAQTRRQAGRRQGLKILAREVNNIAARNVLRSQANWLWDCSTPPTALTGKFVSASAGVFLRDGSIRFLFFLNLSLCDGAFPVAHSQYLHGQRERALDKREVGACCAPREYRR
jgi:hypothetical protein